MKNISKKTLINIKNILVPIAIDAAKLIMDNVNSKIEIKEDGTPVTIADKKADEFIHNNLKNNFSNIPILSEERTIPNNCYGKNLHWIIDPLDGTKSFIEGGNDFSVCISLVMNESPILGCITHPPTLHTWTGGKIIGSEKHNKKNNKNINCREIPASGPVITISRHHVGPKLKEWLSNINYSKTKKLGSALKFCLLAEGRADIFPRTSETFEWDSAAGQAIVEGAGGKVTQINNNPMIYGRSDKKNPNFIAFGKSNWKNFLKEKYID